jgi:hypothetical protein
VTLDYVCHERGFDSRRVAMICRICKRYTCGSCVKPNECNLNLHGWSLWCEELDAMSECLIHGHQLQSTSLRLPFYFCHRTQKMIYWTRPYGEFRQEMKYLQVLCSKHAGVVHKIFSLLCRKVTKYAYMKTLGSL